jgi:hypothetical protein
MELLITGETMEPPMPGGTMELLITGATIEEGAGPARPGPA